MTERRTQTHIISQKDEIVFDRPVRRHEFCMRVGIGNSTFIRMVNQGELEVNVDEYGRILQDCANRLRLEIHEMIKDDTWPLGRRSNKFNF